MDLVLLSISALGQQSADAESTVNEVAGHEDMQERCPTDQFHKTLADGTFVVGKASSSRQWRLEAAAWPAWLNPT